MTIFPACYSGRWPHIHFEGVFRASPTRQRRAIPWPRPAARVAGKRNCNAVLCDHGMHGRERQQLEAGDARERHGLQRRCDARDPGRHREHVERLRGELDACRQGLTVTLPSNADVTPRGPSLTDDAGFCPGDEVSSYTEREGVPTSPRVRSVRRGRGAGSLGRNGTVSASCTARSSSFEKPVTRRP